MRYERRGDAGTATRHVVLLPGFGVGSFHYDALSARLGRDESTCVWALDFCGQGASWPASDEASRDGSLNGFVYSVDAWRDQVVDFARTVVRAEDGVYLAGNSLGGFVATYAAATEESALVKGLILMNATPFWAFVPSDRESLVYKLTPWRGELPAPSWIRSPVKAYWESFRSEKNVRGLLGLVYANKERLDDALVRQIIEPTDNANALCTFCSVVWSPKAKMSFDDMLRRIGEREKELPVALVYGKEDPWVVPLWGQRLKRALPHADYYELSPAGHCPAHECPSTTSEIMRSWMRYVETTRANGDPPPSGSTDGVATLVDGSPRNIFERIDAWRAARAA